MHRPPAGLGACPRRTNKSEAADGSHGTGFTYQIRMFAPSVKEAPRLTVVENFRLRRVDGYQETPTMVREDFSVTCE